MQATNEKLCCDDVFSQKFVRSLMIISCFSRMARHRIEQGRPLSSCNLLCRTSLKRLYGPQQPRLEPGWLRCSRACITFPFPICTISWTECAPAGRILTNRSSTSLLTSGVTNWRLYKAGSSEWWTHWTVVLIVWFICCHALLCIERYCGTVTRSKPGK